MPLAVRRRRRIFLRKPRTYKQDPLMVLEARWRIGPLTSEDLETSHRIAEAISRLEDSRSLGEPSRIDLVLGALQFLRNEEDRLFEFLAAICRGEIDRE